jgi:signal transduction histidine kinase/ligand-binding sensor domain-containing protein
MHPLHSAGFHLCSYMTRRSCILWLIFYLPACCLAQSVPGVSLKRCPVRTINFEQGLLNNGTTAIITDVLGFTWVSTQTGMQRYNGFILQKINPVVNGDTIEINSPVYFFATASGNIWISCKEGIISYNPYTDVFERIIKRQQPGNAGPFIWPLKETNDGIWCFAKNNGLFIRQKSGIIKQLTDLDNYFTNTILKRTEVQDDPVFTCNDQNIFLYDGKEHTVELNLYTHRLQYFKTGSINAMASNNNELFVASGSGLQTFNARTSEISANLPFKTLTTDTVNFSTLLLSDNKELFVGLNNRLFEFDTSFGNKKEITTLGRKPAVSVGLIKSIYTDLHKRIWLLTNDDIKRIQNVDIAFDHFIYPGEKNNFVRSLYYDEQKNILLAGCYNGGIQLYDSSGNTLWKSALVSNAVKDISGIEKLTTDEYLVITIGNGWFILHMSSKKLDPVALLPKWENMLRTHLSNFCNNVQRIDDSTVYIATSTNVFRCIFDKATLRTVQPLLPIESTYNNRIHCFLYDSGKTLWAGTASGYVYRLGPDHAFDTIHIPENYAVRSFTEDAFRDIWVGAEKGLYIYSAAGELQRKITMASGLLNDCIYALQPFDKKEAVIASSNLGLSVVFLHGSITNYSKESGLQENEFNTQSSVKTRAGKLYFGGVNGITSFFPSSLYKLRDSPVLNITSLTVNDSLWNSSSGIWKGDTIRLKYPLNHLQIDYAALGLLNTNEYNYKYRLLGYEKEWQTTHQPTGIKYILEPGTYELQISCRPILSFGGDFIKTITVIVYPPWWKTWWFNTLLAILGLGLVILPVQQYSRRRYLRRIRTLEIQHSIQQERERISRDLHDNLGAYAASIASNIAAIKNSNSITNPHFLYNLQDNSKSIIDQLNDTIWALNKETISLTAVSDRFKIFLQKIQGSYPQVDIVINEAIENDIALSPAHALHLFRIMQESVNNALRHSKCHNIAIQVSSKENWEIAITDDGTGMPEDTSPFNSGNGLKNIRVRSHDAGWSVEWQKVIPQGTSLVIHPDLLVK